MMMMITMTAVCIHKALCRFSAAHRYKEITAVDVNRLHSAPLNYCFELANDILAPPKKAFVLLIIFSNHACLCKSVYVSICICCGGAYSFQQFAAAAVSEVVLMVDRTW